jgi:hypothetical protein
LIAVKSKEDPVAPSVVGSLPATIEPNHLPLLNEALAFLFQELATAAALHQSGADVGREGVIHSVETAVKFLSVFSPVISSALHAPLGQLLDALLSLDDGRALPLLTPVKQTGRPRASALRGSLIGAAVYTVDRLTETGLPAHRARDAVARTLKAARVKPARGRAQIITRRTIRSWCEEVSADVGRHGEAAQTYDPLINDPSLSPATHLPPLKARAVLLEWLAVTARRIRAQEGA